MDTETIKSHLLEFYRNTFISEVLGYCATLKTVQDLIWVSDDTPISQVLEILQKNAILAVPVYQVIQSPPFSSINGSALGRDMDQRTILLGMIGVWEILVFLVLKNAKTQDFEDLNSDSVRAQMEADFKDTAFIETLKTETEIMNTPISAILMTKPTLPDTYETKDSGGSFAALTFESAQRFWVDEEGTNLSQLLAMFTSYGMHRCVVRKKNGNMTILSQTDITRYLANEALFNVTLFRELMETPCSAIKKDQKFYTLSCHESALHGFKKMFDLGK